MSARQPDRKVVCSQCGAVLGPESTQCWLCFAPAARAGTWAEGARAAPSAPADDSWPGTPAVAAPSPGRAAPTAQEHHTPPQFGLSSLLLMVTLTAVVLGIGAMAPGLAVALVVLTAPALVRTAGVAVRRAQRGEPLSIKAKMWVFGGTMALLAIIGIAVPAAFVLTCFPVALAAFGMESMFLLGLAFVLGIAVSLLVLYFLFRWFRRLWPR